MLPDQRRKPFGLQRSLLRKHLNNPSVIGHSHLGTGISYVDQQSYSSRKSW